MRVLYLKISNIKGLLKHTCKVKMFYQLIMPINCKRYLVSNKNKGYLNVAETVCIGGSFVITLEELGEPSK